MTPRNQVRKKSRRRNTPRRPKPSRKVLASAKRTGRELIRAAMHKVNSTSANGKTSPSKANGTHHHNGASILDYQKDELESAIRRYAELYDFAPVPYVTFDRIGRIEEANLTTARLLGRERDSLIGAPFALHIHKPDADVFLHHLLRCRSAKKKTATELRVKNRQGEIIPVEISSAPTYSSIGDRILLFQTVIIDLRERKAAETALRQSEERYRTLFNFVPVAVYTCDAEGRIQEFNQRAVDLWGRKPKTNDSNEKFCGSFKIFYPDGRVMPHSKCPMARVLRSEQIDPNGVEIMVERANGIRLNVLVNPTTLQNERGRIVGAINCMHDITERKRANDALRQSEELYRAFVNQTAVGMARTDLKGRIVFANQKFCEILGYNQSELIGKSIRDIIHRDYVSETRRSFQRLVKKGIPYHLEKRYLRKNGSLVWAKVSASPLRDAEGKTRGAVAVVRDISERKKAEAELENAKLLLENRVQERTSELAAANLELQNEISRRKGLEGEILEVSDREQQQIGRELHDGICQHLTAVAFMAHSTAIRLKNHRVISVEDVEKIKELINDAADDARDIARSLHTLDVGVAELMPSLQDLVIRKIWTTPCRLEIKTSLVIPDDESASQLFRIVREAIINANKHARARIVIVRIEKSGDETVVSVNDDGVGIRDHRRKTGGMGFHIMNYRAQAIGARLKIESVKPHGVRVACYLPQK